MEDMSVWMIVVYVISALVMGLIISIKMDEIDDKVTGVYKDEHPVVTNVILLIVMLAFILLPIVNTFMTIQSLRKVLRNT
jgi:hypothetical protein